MITVVFTVECHCGADATKATTYLDDPGPSGELHIDAELAVCQETFRCPDCGCEIHTGDLYQEPEPEECPTDGEDNDENDAQEDAEEGEAVMTK